MNYLLLLGWSLDDKTEFFTRPEMIAQFSLERVNKAPASFDVKKLRAFQERYMALESVERKTEMVLPFLQKAKLLPESTTPSEIARVTEIVRVAGERIKVAGDILDYAAFFLPDDQLPYDEKALNQHVRKPEANALLRKIRQRLETATFEPKALEALVQDFVQSEGVKFECHQSAAARGRHRQGGRFRHLRDAGAAGPRALPCPYRPRAVADRPSVMHGEAAIDKIKALHVESDRVPSLQCLCPSKKGIES